MFNTNKIALIALLLALSVGKSFARSEKRAELNDPFALQRITPALLSERKQSSGQAEHRGLGFGQGRGSFRPRRSKVMKLCRSSSGACRQR